MVQPAEKRQRWRLAILLIQIGVAAGSNMSAFDTDGALETGDSWPRDMLIRRLVKDFVDKLNIDNINFIIEDRSLSRLVCVITMRQLYTARQRVHRVTCSHLLGDWVNTQRTPLATGRSLTVGVFLSAASLAGELKYMMERNRFNEQFLIVTVDDWVPSVAVENCHWFQVRLHQNLPSAIIQEAWTFPYDPAPIVETRGTWSMENGLYLCPQLAKGPTSFQGRTLRVGIVDDQNYIKLEKLPNGDIKTSGFLGALLGFLEERLQFRAEVHESAKYITHENITRGGMFGKVYQRQLEIGLGAYAIVEERRALVDFTPHIESTHHSFLIRDPTLALPDDEVNWAAYLSPFGLFVWLAVLGLGLLAWLTSTIIIHVLSGPVDTRSSAADSAWIVTGTILQQGTGLQPTTLSARQAMICLWMLSTLLYTAYTSNIVSLLASDRFAMPFHTLEELKNLKDWKILIRKDAFEYQLIQKIHSFESHRFVDIAKLEDGIDLVLQGGKYALFTPVSNIGVRVEEDCRLAWTAIKLGYNRGHVILQKDLPYGDRISNAIHVIGEAGIISETWRKKTEKKLVCTETNTLPAMSLRHTLPAFVLLLLGLLASVMLLGLERLCRRTAARSWRYRHRRVANHFLPVLVTSPEPTAPPCHLSADRDCHLPAGDESTLPLPLSDWPLSAEMDRFLSGVDGLRPPGSCDSTVTEVMVRRTSVTPQRHVQVLVHRRVTSATDRGRDSADSWPSGYALVAMLDDGDVPGGKQADKA